jgi:hypothetical protein
MKGTVTVYNFRKYDIVSDDFIISARMATRIGIRQINAQIIRGTGIEINRADVNGDGMTEVGFLELIKKSVKLDAKAATPRGDVLS